jgi:hypothetical protein
VGLVQRDCSIIGLLVDTHCKSIKTVMFPHARPTCVREVFCNLSLPDLVLFNIHRRIRNCCDNRVGQGFGDHQDEAAAQKGMCSETSRRASVVLQDGSLCRASQHIVSLIGERLGRLGYARKVRCKLGLRRGACGETPATKSSVLAAGLDDELTLSRMMTLSVDCLCLRVSQHGTIRLARRWMLLPRLRSEYV